MRFLSLFTGIGMMDLGLERAGMTCVGQVEIDPVARRVLEKHWLYVEQFLDIRYMVAPAKVVPGPIDVVCAAWPHKGRFLDGVDLFEEMLRVYRESGARWFIGEGVEGSPWDELMPKMPMPNISWSVGGRRFIWSGPALRLPDVNAPRPGWPDGWLNVVPLLTESEVYRLRTNATDPAVAQAVGGQIMAAAGQIGGSMVLGSASCPPTR